MILGLRSVAADVGMGSGTLQEITRSPCCVVTWSLSRVLEKKNSRGLTQACRSTEVIRG